MVQSGHYCRAVSFQAADQFCHDVCCGTRFNLLLGKKVDPGEPKLDSSKTDTSCKVGYLTSRRLVLGAQQINENKDMTRNKVPTRYILAAAFFLTLILPIGIGLYTPRDPWIDEAMLTNNFVEMSLGQLRHPMPLYEQAAPIAYIILAKFVLLFSGFVDPIFALRALSAAISLVGILFLVRLAREEASKASAVALAVLLFTSPFFVRYATEIKQYIFDFAATAMIAYGAGGIARSAKTQDFVRFIVWVILGCLLSFVAIVPIVACLSAAALVRILREISRTSHAQSNGSGQVESRRRNSAFYCFRRQCCADCDCILHCLFAEHDGGEFDRIRLFL